jgi:hypothetical protein
VAAVPKAAALLLFAATVTAYPMVATMAAAPFVTETM